ncbi:hypothetical protein GGR58DRAFT_453893 [Xylaria digitata]|nr:hypothetical protein GGR58DRAFT_453893 [Xylaria digitata]
MGELMGITKTKKRRCDVGLEGVGLGHAISKENYSSFLATSISPSLPNMKKWSPERFYVEDWERLTDEESGRVAKRPFRALVKKLVSSGVSVSNPRRMLGDLKKLRKIGIYQRDVFVRNYMDGLLVDFSLAWTEPHWSFVPIGDY